MQKGKECSAIAAAEQAPVEFTSFGKQVSGEHIFVNCGLENLCLQARDGITLFKACKSGFVYTCLRKSFQTEAC